MVKNNNGGNKAKGMARKFTNQKPTQVLRQSQDNLELYGQCIKLFGGNKFEVLCDDGIKRMCNIPGKFRGRNKRSNQVVVQSIILVGLRDYEAGTEGIKAIKNCDLLEVYSTDECERLRTANPSVHWNLFLDSKTSIEKSNNTQKSTVGNAIDVAPQFIPSENDFDLNFVDDDTYNYHIIEQEKNTSSNANITYNFEIIDIDDI